MSGEAQTGRGAEPHRVRLRDGCPVTVLVLSRDDAELGQAWLRQRIADEYQHLSPRSRRLRFISPPHHLAPWQLDYLSDLDPARSAIWVARDDSGPQPVGAGLARYMRIPGEPGVAEVALTVLDGYQNRGLGHIFLDLMAAHAGAHGLKLLRGYVLPENRIMLHLFEAFGARPPVPEDGLLRLELEV